MTNAAKKAIENTKNRLEALDAEMMKMQANAGQFLENEQMWTAAVAQYAAKRQEWKTLKAQLETLEAIAAEENAIETQKQAEIKEEPKETPKKRTSAAKNPAKFSPVSVYLESGVDGLAGKLSALDVQELKDIIRDYSFDRTNKYRNWKNRDRLVNLILETAERKATRGDVFRVFTSNRSNVYTA